MIRSFQRVLMVRTKGPTVGIPADTVPNAFSFGAPVPGVALGSAQTSPTITVSGLGAENFAVVTIMGGVYYKNGGPASATTTVAVNGDTFAVGHSASGINSTSVNTTLTIGGVSDTFTSTTVPVAQTPTFPTTTDATLPVPSLTLVSVNSDGSSPSFDIGNLADAQVGDTLWIEQRNKAGSLVARFYNTIDDAEATAEAANFGLSAITANTGRYSAFLARGSVVSTGSTVVIAGPDDVEPTLSAPTVTGITSSAATVGATTDEGNGTLYVVLTTANSAPSALQVENGQTSTGAAAAKAGSVAVTSAGAKTVSLTGLSVSTTYYRWLMHKDAAGNRSAVLAGGSFATNAASTQTLLWSTTDKNADITTSNGAKTATITSGSGARGIRTNIPVDLTKKSYHEILVSAKTGTMSVGLVNGSASLSAYMGADANGYVVLFSLPGFFTNNAGDGGVASTGNLPATPFTLCLAIDGPNKKISGKILGQTWMPGANTDLDESNMKSFAALTGTLYLGMSSDQINDAVTIRSISGDMLGVIPTGYQAVDA